MKKIIISVLASLTFLSIVYFTIILSMDFEESYQKFQKQITDAGYEAQAASIEVVKFPIPQVDLGNVTIVNLLSATKLEIKFSLLSILMMKPTIQNIEITGANIIDHKNSLDLLAHEKSISDIIKIIPKLPNIIAHNLVLIDKNTKLPYEHIDRLLIDPKSDDHQLVVNWNDSDSTNISYKNTANGAKVHIESTGEAYTLKLDEMYSNEKLQSGTVKYSINNLQKFVASMYQDIDLLITKIQSPEPAEFECNMRRDADRVRISDIKLTSQSLSMSGNMDVYRSIKPDLINLSFDFIDLKTLLAAPNMELINESKSKEKLGLYNVVRNINVTAKKVVLADAELQDFLFNAFIDQKKLKINTLSANIVGGGEFAITGTVEQNQYRSMFEGNLNLRHKDANILLTKFGYADLTTKTPTSFILVSDVTATPIDYQLSNIFLKLGNFSADGAASVKFIGHTPRINLTLGLSSVDLLGTEYPLLSKLVAYLKDLTTDMYAKDYLKKYIPLRKIDYLGNFDISFTDLDVGDEQIDKLRIISDVSAGKIMLNSIYYQDGQNYISGSGYLAAAGIKPEIGLKVNEAMLETSSFDVAHILKFFQSLKTDYDFNKLNFNTEIAIQSLKQHNKTFRNLLFNAKNDGILWNISSLGSDYSSGNFSSSGSLRMDAMNLNLAYAFNDFGLKGVADIVPLTLFGIEDGWMSMNGMISTSGATIDQLFYNLYSKSTFLAKDVKWNNFDVDSLIAKSDDIKYVSSKLENDAISCMNHGNTIMHGLSGDMELNHGSFKFSGVKLDTTRSSATATAEYNIYNNKLLINSIFSFAQQNFGDYGGSQSVAFNMDVAGDIINPKKTFILADFKTFIDNKAANSGWYQQGVNSNLNNYQSPVNSAR